MVDWEIVKKCRCAARDTCALRGLPMSEEFDRQTVIDNEHLRLLSLGYMISAAMTAVGTLFSLLYVVAGIVAVVVLSRHPEVAGKTGQQAPAFIGWIIAGI